jgi:hypothetical protein
MPAGPGSGPSSLQLEVAAELFPDEPKGFPFHINPAEVQLPPGEDFGIQSDDDTQQEEDINEAEAGFGSVLGTRADWRPRSRCSCCQTRAYNRALVYGFAF